MSDPMYAEEPCWQCGGFGVIDSDDCDACAGTGLLYTADAIRLQVAAEDDGLGRAQGGRR